VEEHEGGSTGNAGGRARPSGAGAGTNRGGTAVGDRVLPDAEPVGVAVSPRGGRVFVTLPFSDYSDGKHTASLVAVLAGGRTRPYPPPSARWCFS
jgi:hypothetical protein